MFSGAEAPLLNDKEENWTPVPELRQKYWHDDPKQRRPDITLAKTVLKWEPQVPLEEGLRRTIAYFRSTR